MATFLGLAASTQPCCAKNLTEDEPFGSSESSASIKISHLPEKEYDFVEELAQDYLCPVTLELLRDPQQTTCCGHHLSVEAATRLQQGGKPCPMCNEPNLTTMPDKFYKRKVNELKVRCPNKGSGCEWVGDLGSVDQHVNSCPKRPCQCDFCGFKDTYEVVTNDHSPVCVKYPEPCPNQCEIGTVPRCDMEKHLTQCPLQLVECEFAQAGCREKIPRQNLSCHMEEGAQCHLLSMSLFNLNLTRELHQKMDEKDRQIVTLQEQNRELQQQNEELQQQGKQTEKQLSLVQDAIQQQGRTAADDLKQQVAILQQKLEQQEKQSENLSGKTTVLLHKLDKKVVAKVADLQTRVEQQVEQLDKKVVANGQKVAALQTRVEQQGEQLDKKVIANGQKVAALQTRVEQQGEQLDKKVVANGQKVAALQTRVEQQGEQLDKKVVANGQKVVALQTRVEQQGEQLDKKVVANGQKVAALQTRVEQQGKQMKEQLEQHRKEVREGVLNKVPKLEQQAVQLHDKTYQALSTFKEEVTTHLSATLPLCHREMVITDCESKRKQSFFSYFGESFYCQGYKFKLNIVLLHDGSTRANIYPREGDNDDRLRWPIVCSGRLLLLNQLGDHDHHTANFQVLMNKDTRGSWHRIASPFTKSGELGLNAQQHTQYLKDDSLHFKWSFTVIPK